MSAPSLATDGFSVHSAVVAEPLAARLRTLFVPGIAGDRTGLLHAAVRELAASPSVRALIEPVLGCAATAHRATLFDKPPDANWFVAWHQDLVVPVRERVDAPGYGPWSQKADGWHVQPPRDVLEGLLAVRVDLDGSGVRNGGVKVLPGSHGGGVLGAGEIAAWGGASAAVVPEVPRCGALCFRPLLLHASSRAVEPGHRRIVHLEFGPAELPGGVRWRVGVG